jgi:hypothetical protein
MKKTIPLAILETLQPVADNNSDIISSIKIDNALFHLVDNDPDSDFYFAVFKNEKRTDGNVYYQTQYKPTNKDNVNPSVYWFTIETLKEVAYEWVDMIISYNQLRTVYDDPILKSYEEAFYKKMKIVDEDAEVAPFDLDKQLLLEAYLVEANSALEKLKLAKDEKTQNEISALQLEANQLRQDLPKLTKQKIMRKLSKFWAKGQIIGLDVIKEIFINVAAEYTKKLIGL